MANMAPIFWFSKKQNTIESSIFGSEFIALKQATEIIEGLIYKLLMLGIPVISPTSAMQQLFSSEEWLFSRTCVKKEALFDLIS